MIRAIIFDMDGVLVNSEPIKAKSWKYTLNKFSIPNGDRFYAKKIGVPGLAIAAEAVKKFKLAAEPKKVMHISDDYYRTHSNTVPGIAKTIRFLKLIPATILVGVASSGRRKIILSNLKRLGIYKRVKVVVSGFDDGLPDKPDPAVYLHAAKFLDVNPKDCVAIEDSQTGIDAAKAAKMFCVGFAKKGKSLKADLVISDINKLSITKLNLLKNAQIRKL